MIRDLYKLLYFMAFDATSTQQCLRCAWLGLCVVMVSLSIHCMEFSSKLKSILLLETGERCRPKTRLFVEMKICKLNNIIVSLGWTINEINRRFSVARSQLILSRPTYKQGCMNGCDMARDIFYLTTSKPLFT